MTQRREAPCARTPGNAAGMAYLGGKGLSPKAKECELQSQPVSLPKARSILRERHCTCSPRPQGQLTSTASPETPSVQDGACSCSCYPVEPRWMPLLPGESTEIDRSHQRTLQMPALASTDAVNASLPAPPASALSCSAGRLSLAFCSQPSLSDQGSPRANLITANYCKRDQRSFGTCPSALYTC